MKLFYLKSLVALTTFFVLSSISSVFTKSYAASPCDELLLESPISLGFDESEDGSTWLETTQVEHPQKQTPKNRQTRMRVINAEIASLVAMTRFLLEEGGGERLPTNDLHRSLRQNRRDIKALEAEREALLQEEALEIFAIDESDGQ